MTLSDEILKLQTNLADSYTACNGKGATIPANQNFDNLPDCIDSIQASTPAVITSLTVTPSTTQQTITAPSGTDGYNPITVDAVTSSIDSNIVAGNIKDGVSILGVTGTYTGGGSFIGIPREVTGAGEFQVPTQSFTFTLPSNVTSIGFRGLAYAYASSLGLIAVDLSNVESITGLNACFHAFEDCSNLSQVDLSNLKSITGQTACSNMFARTTGLTSISLTKLESITGYNACISMFFRTGLTSISFPKLESITGDGACTRMLNNCTNLGSVSFPALTSTSFGSYTNQFYYMLIGVTGCTVHFPSNLQAVIGSWGDVTTGFAGNNTVVLFDLPATT